MGLIMFATCRRKIAGRPISAAGKLSLARAGFSAQSYKPPPRPPKLPRFPSIPNSIEGELRWKYEEHRAFHEKLVRSYTKSELSVHGKAAGQTFDCSYLSTDDLVILKGGILPDVVAFAQTSGCSVSTSLMAEAKTFSTMKVAFGFKSLKIAAIISESPTAVWGVAALAASPHCAGLLGMTGAVDAMVAAPVAIEQFTVFLMSLEASVAVLSSEVAATAASVGLEAIVTETVVAGVAEAGFFTFITGGLWKVTLPLRAVVWAYQAREKWEQVKLYNQKKQKEQDEVLKFWEEMKVYQQDAQKFLDDFDRYLNLLKAWDFYQRFYISKEVTKYYKEW